MTMLCPACQRPPCPCGELTYAQASGADLQKQLDKARKERDTVTAERDILIDWLNEATKTIRAEIKAIVAHRLAMRGQ
jgi:hypothetical protein